MYVYMHTHIHKETTLAYIDEVTWVTIFIQDTF